MHIKIPRIALGGLLALAVVASSLFLKTEVGSELLAQVELTSHRLRHEAAEAVHSLLTTLDGETWIDGDDIAYFSVAHGYYFDRPYRWQARSEVETDALQSAGFAPFGFDPMGRLERQETPAEEIIVSIRRLGPDEGLESAVNRRKASDSPGTGVTLGSRAAIRYTTPDGLEAVTAVLDGKEYTLLLKPKEASERIRSAFERAISSFRFIDRNLRVY